MSATIILLGDDLIFSSRIAATARNVGGTPRSARSVAAALALAQQEQPACVIVDLGLSSLALPALVQGLSGLPKRPRIVAYGSHVDAAGLQAARDAGCDFVLARSQFVDRLESDLPKWLSP